MPCALGCARRHHSDPVPSPIDEHTVAVLGASFLEAQLACCGAVQQHLYLRSLHLVHVDAERAMLCNAADPRITRSDNASSLTAHTELCAQRRLHARLGRCVPLCAPATTTGTGAASNDDNDKRLPECAPQLGPPCICVAAIGTRTSVAVASEIDAGSRNVRREL